MISQNNKSLSKIGNLDWSTENRLDSVQVIYDSVIGMAKDAAEWYRIKKKWVRRWARFLRLSAIVITTFAALVPMLSNIISYHNKPLDPVWASIALAISAALIVMDRFFFFSASWMRFITSELKIDALLQDFQLDWEIQKAALEGKMPEDAQVQEQLQKSKTLLKNVNEIITKESEQWKNDFSNALKQIDKNPG